MGLRCVRAGLILLGAALTMYSAWCIVVLPYSIGNYLTGLVGLPVLGAGVLLPQILAYSERGWRRRLRFAVVVGVSLGVVSFLVLLAGVQMSARIVPQSGHDAVIVLGAALVGDVIPQGFRNRLDTAIGYLSENDNAVVVVSGGQGRTETVTAAYAMKLYLMENGVSPERIIKEERATSTYENFLFSKELLGEHLERDDFSVVFVTNDFHLLRARLLAWNVGISGEGLAAPSQFFMLPNYYSREFLAMIRALFMVATAN